MHRACFLLMLKRQNTARFCVRASDLQLGDNEDVDKDTISIVKDSPWDTTL